MANRINTFLLKRSSIPGKIPSPGQLLLGEIALNSADAMLYTSGTTANSILPIGWDRISRTGDTMSGALYGPTISATTYLNLPISIVNVSNLFSTGLIDTGTNVDSITYSNFFGEGAGSSALYASYSNFLGYQAGYNATYANDSNFIGQQAGYGATFSNDSNFIGTHAGSGATNAHNSNFIGNEAGNNAISASDSNFMGHYAGNGATSAYNSNFFGLSAGHEAINAHQSNFIGNEAGTNADNADFSNFMGQLAGAFAVNARHSNFIGQNAGYQATESEYSNFLGYNVGNGGVLGSLGSNNIIIGTNISLPSGTTSSLNLGGVLFGQNTYTITTGDPSIVAQTDGRIGINVVNPSEALHVAGNTLVDGNLIANTISATTYYNLPLDVKVTGSTLNPGNYDFTLTRNDGVTITSNLGILSSDMVVTGGTYNINTGVVTFTNNSGGTFNVTGFTSGMTDTFTTGGTYADGTTIFTKTNGETYSVSGYTTPFTGGTVSGSTTFTNGLTTNTFSATTYLGLPTDIRVTGGTYGSGTTVFSNNTGGTFNITGYTYIPHLQYNNSNSTVWNYGYGNLSDNISFGKNALVSTTNGNNNTAFGSESLSANTTGNYNAGIGAGSLKYNTTGVQNFGIGAYALHYNTTGNYNTGIGTAALQNNTGAERNVAIGGFSLYNNTGSRNIAIGFYAGSATKGSDNILLGANSNNGTDGLVSGSNNTIIGTLLSGVINGSNNTIFGKPTGLSSTTTNNIVIADGSGNIRFRDNNVNTILPRLAGSGNRMVIAGPNGELSSTTIFDTFVTGGTYSTGTAVFTNNTGGTFSVTGFSTSNGVTFTGGTVTGATIFTNGLTANTFSAATYLNLPNTSPISVISGSSLFSTGLFETGLNSSGVTYSNFFGYGAGFNATGASQSNFFGNQAGYNATNAAGSNFFGNQAGKNATGATQSNFIGTYAGNEATGASQSNFIGYFAGYNAKNAFQSNFMGQRAGYDAINASNSNFIGYWAGQYASGASNSNFIGQEAGNQATNAFYSNFFGYRAGQGATAAYYSNFFGFNAGRDATVATNSTLIGYNVGNATALGSLGSNNIIIGTNISLPSGTTNSINLGGVLFGQNTYTTTTGDPSIVAQTNGRIGINVVNPSQALHISGNTLINGSLTANTISATTYLNLPTDIRVTGGTYSDGTAVFSNNTGGTFSVTGFSTSNGVTFTGGTVTGATIFTNGLTANTFSATSINSVDYMVFNTNTLSAATVPGTVYFDNTEHALSYNTSINQGVTVNLGQQNYVRVFNNSGSDIQRGKALEVLSAYSGLPSVTLAINKHTGFNIIGVSAEIIPNNSEGIAITYGIISNIEMTGITIGSFVYASDTIPGKLDDPSKYLNFPLTARTNQIGYVVQTGTTTGKLFVDIKNENSVLSLTDLERNVLEGNTLSTGLFEFTGMTTASTTTFNVASLKGWLIKNTYTYALLPDVQSINYTGGTNIPVINIATADSTYILINSGITITQQVTFPTPQQRRENIYLGKINHPNRSTILNINNTADYDVSPMSSLRDLWSPIKLINQGIIPSPNGANLSFNTSAGILWGNGINWHNNQLSPNNVNIAAKVPASFNYRTRTGGTSTSVSVIDPRNYDVGGVITSVGGAGSDDSTNQRIYMYPTGVINVLYGQTRYGNLAAAVAAIDSEDFIPYPNAESTGILIGVLSVRNDIGTDGQPLTNTNYAKFTLVSKFGESFGGTGGLSTTTLQQAYDNSSNPEIVINAVLDGLTIQNGTGNADNVTRLLEGSNAAANVTSFIRADGYISGTTFQTNGTFLNNGGITATTVSATTYLNLPTSGGGTFTGGTVTGPTTFTNGLTANTISATTYYNLPLDVYVTGSTLNPANYDFTLTRNDGVTITSNLGILSSDMTVTGGTYDINTGVVTFTNNSGGTFNVTGFTSGMTDTFTTGGTVSSGTATFTKSDGSIYSVSGFSVGNEYWSSGTGLNSVIQINSNSFANGEGALAGGSGNSANSKYSVALGINSIANGSELLPVKTQKTVISGITITSSDPYYGYPAVVFGGDVTAEWGGYFNGSYGNENPFIIYDGVGNTYTLYDYNLTNIYYDDGDSYNTYIVGDAIPLTSYITISGSPYYGLPTPFEAPAFVFGSNSVVIGGNSIVLGNNITGTSENTTYVDYLDIKRFKNDNVIFGNGAGNGATNAQQSNFFGQAAGYNATGVSQSNFFGQAAGYSAINAGASNFLGYQAGYGATGASNSNFLGNGAGNGATNAQQSNFFGNLAGASAINADNSNFFGTLAGQGATSADFANFFGNLAGQGATNAYQSNFFGANAGYGATNARTSNFFGSNAGFQAIYAINSNFFGSSAGDGATNAEYSNLFGRLAGYKSTNASYSNLFGYNVGNGEFLGNLGSNNIIIGTNISLLSGTTNSINLGGVLFGKNTYATTTGNPSIIGQTNGRIGINVVNPTEALHVSGNTLINGNLTANTISATTYLNLPNTSPINIISGSSLFSTGLSLTGLNASGVTNSNFFGASAGFQATNANASNFFGFQAGYGATNANNANFFGRNSGLAANSASYSNLFGYNVGNSLGIDSIGSNNIIIGTNISLPSLTTNSINIGGVLFGINTYGITTGIPSISAQTNGRIGINVVNPSEALHVAGNTLINGNLTATTISATTYLNLPTSGGGTFTGGTVSGATRFTNGLTANTISATTYYNLPIDVRVTGGTYSAGTAVFSNNTGGTFSVTGFSTSTGGGTTFTGGTVSGKTSFTGGLSANTITVNPPSESTGLTINLTHFTSGILVNTATSLESPMPIIVSVDNEAEFTVNQLGEVNTPHLEATTIGTSQIFAGTYLNLPSSTFSGGTVTGPTTFTNGLSANTFSATTIEGGDLDFMMVSLFRTLYNY